MKKDWGGVGGGGGGAILFVCCRCSYHKLISSKTLTKIKVIDLIIDIFNC